MVNLPNGNAKSLFVRNPTKVRQDNELSTAGNGVDKLSLTETSDEQLMVLVVAGDNSALATLYDRYAPVALGVVDRIVQDRAAAEEVLQECFMRVWDHAETFDPAAGLFRSWFFSIARRLAIDIYRRRKVRPQPVRHESESLQMAQTPDGTDVVASVETSLAMADVNDALASLSPEQRQVIELAYFEGQTRREIAATIDVPLGTVNTRARLALRQLRYLLAANQDT